MDWFLTKTQILDEVNTRMNEDQDYFALSTILALGVTFYARLEDRRAYVEKVSRILQFNPENFIKVIRCSQEVIIDEMRLETTVAKNDALMENCWMMAICIELRIPLFLVGKKNHGYVSKIEQNEN